MEEHDLPKLPVLTLASISTRMLQTLREAEELLHNGRSADAWYLIQDALDELGFEYPVTKSVQTEDS